MDAEGLIKATRHALVECTSVPGIVAEAWQTQALAEAIGSHLAVNGPQSVRAEALGLSEMGVRARGSPPDAVSRGARGVRAERLTGIQDQRCALADLGELLAEVGVALVLVAVSAEEEGLYWQCIEAIDVADESGDRVAGMLRRLQLQEHGGAA
ncbi:MAG: DUF6099 family protein [Streptomyces sp.]|uniref:DUF6099 family protein n=1 Tax=Streptomyces sp. TaxID=1931 RepID=UPI003D6BEB56